MDEKLLYALEIAFDKTPEEAVQYLQSQGYKVTWDWVEQIKAIKEHSFTVSKVLNADVLVDVKEALEKALANGTTFEQFQKDLTDTLKERGYFAKADGSAWRLDVIFRTNLQSAYMAGRRLEQLNVAKEFPFWQYVAVLDNRTRPSHRRLNNIILRCDDPFWKTSYPPNGYQCRCRVRSLNESQIEELGFKINKSIDVKSFNPDKGFESAPGVAWKPDLKKYPSDIRNQLKKVV